MSAPGRPHRATVVVGACLTRCGAAVSPARELPERALARALQASPRRGAGRVAGAAVGGVVHGVDADAVAQRHPGRTAALAVLAGAATGAGVPAAAAVLESVQLRGLAVAAAPAVGDPVVAVAAVLAGAEVRAQPVAALLGERGAGSRAVAAVPVVAAQVDALASAQLVPVRTDAPAGVGILGAAVAGSGRASAGADLRVPFEWRRAGFDSCAGAVAALAARLAWWAPGAALAAAELGAGGTDAPTGGGVDGAAVAADRRAFALARCRVPLLGRDTRLREHAFAATALTDALDGWAAGDAATLAGVEPRRAAGSGAVGVPSRSGTGIELAGADRAGPSTLAGRLLLEEQYLARLRRRVLLALVGARLGVDQALVEEEGAAPRPRRPGPGVDWADGSPRRRGGCFGTEPVGGLQSQASKAGRLVRSQGGEGKHARAVSLLTRRRSAAASRQETGTLR